MHDVFYYFVLILAGMLAGVITGLVSASASAIMTPLLTILLKIDVYTALGISLITDVIASLTTTVVYAKHKCVDFKKSVLLVSVATVFSFVGSFISKDTSNILLGSLSGIGIFMLSLQFLKGNFASRLDNFRQQKWVHILLQSPNLFIIVAGVAIGLNTGIMGAGGGVLILFTLMIAYGMPMKTAIGTSAFVMAVIAFCGGTTHFFYNGFSLVDVAITSASGVVGAMLASHFVHSTNEQVVSRSAGVVFGFVSIMMITNQFTTLY